VRIEARERHVVLQSSISRRVKCKSPALLENERMRRQQDAPPKPSGGSHSAEPLASGPPKHGGARETPQHFEFGMAWPNLKANRYPPVPSGRRAAVTSVMSGGCPAGVRAPLAGLITWLGRGAAQHGTKALRRSKGLAWANWHQYAQPRTCLSAGCPHPYECYRLLSETFTRMFRRFKCCHSASCFLAASLIMSNILAASSVLPARRYATAN
jgi:hypothetical protein